MTGQFFLNKKIFEYLTVLAVAVILLLVIKFAYNNGKRSAQARNMGLAASEVLKAVDYFYRDQNRLPSALEFQDRNIMINYFTRFPPVGYVSGQCPGEVWLYQRESFYLGFLSVCMPADYQGAQAGWNKITISK